MKKIIAALLCGIVFMLLGCDKELKEENPTKGTTTAVATTAAATPETISPTATPTTTQLDPNRKMAVMEPLQGGEMLYAFQGRKPYQYEISEEDGEKYPLYPLGLIDQNGKLVAEPIYHKVDYIYDEYRQRIIGLAAVKDRELVIYQLNGKSRKLPCDGYRIDVYPGGRYGTVMAAEYGSLSGGDVSDPLKDGLYDIRNNRYVIEPKDGQLIQYHSGGIVFGYQYDSKDYPREQTSQWYFNCADGCVRDLPMSLGRVQEYYPETGWFGAMHMVGEWHHRYYDANLKLIENLTGWIFDLNGFHGSEYARLYNNNNFPGMEKWVNRKGELFSERPNETTELPNDSQPPPLPFDLDQFMPSPKPGDGDSIEPFVSIVLSNDDYIILESGRIVENMMLSDHEIFAVDWQGNRLPDYPLKPFAEQLSNGKTAGEQGPNYYWVEHKGKRGYIDVYGNWLFVEKT